MRAHGSIWAVRAVLYSLLALSLLPLALMLFLSLKTNVEIITSFWRPPTYIQWSNYTQAFAAIFRSILSSLFVASVSCCAIVFLSSLSGFVFARHRFPGREVLFMALLGLIMIPNVLLLVPLFVEVKQMGLTDTYWALVFPYTAHGQVVGILLCRGFFSTIPEDYFESARLDGASEFTLYRRIVLPLSYPILTVIAIINFHAIYNDFVWPLMVLQDQDLKTFAVAIFDLSTVYRSEYGLTFAAYAIGALPLVLLLLAGMRYFIQGISQGGLKV